jgi:hypothetical protein
MFNPAFFFDIIKKVKTGNGLELKIVNRDAAGIDISPTEMQVYPVNAKSVKNFIEEKTDEADAESLMLMHAYGLLKPGFQVNNFAREIRNLSRHRENLIRTSS